MLEAALLSRKLSAYLIVLPGKFCTVCVSTLFIPFILFGPDPNPVLQVFLFLQVLGSEPEPKLDLNQYCICPDAKSMNLLV
jgi:hypothetical protein